MQTHDIEQGLPETVSLLDKLRMAIYHGELLPGQVTRDHMASVVDALHQLEDMSMPRIMAAGFGR